jgi:O-antigen/teichoic acid export membrane protein
MKAISLSVVTLGAIFGVSAALAKPLVLVVYGEKYAGAIPIFGIICLGEAFKLTGGFAGSALVAAGKSKIPLYAWLVPYPIMAGGIALAWNHISLTNIALSYMIGMVTVNVIVIICAFVNLKVDRAQVAKFWAALGCVALITGIAYGISLLPLSPLPHFLLALAIIPPIYAGIIGTVLARNPLAFISRSGPTRLREAL